MKSFSIQRVGNYRKEDGEVLLAEGQRATLGAAVDADLTLRRSTGVPASCLVVWVEHGKCLAENVSRNPRLVTLNGQPLYSVGQLEKGDLLQIGHDQFTVVFQDETPLQRIAPTAVPVEAEPPRYVPSTVLNAVLLNAALSQHTPQDSAWEFTDLLPWLVAEFDAFLLANFRHAGLSPTAAVETGQDLFEHAPDEVRDIYSLHAIGDVAVEQKLEVYERLQNRDATVWVVPEEDMAQSLEDAKIYLAWFARPSVLDMTLQKSPKEFTEGLLKPFKAIFLEGSNGSDWVMYTKADFDPAQFQLEKSVPATV